MVWKRIDPNAPGPKEGDYWVIYSESYQEPQVMLCKFIKDGFVGALQFDGFSSDGLNLLTGNMRMFYYASADIPEVPVYLLEIINKENAKEKWLHNICDDPYIIPAILYELADRVSTMRNLQKTAHATGNSTLLHESDLAVARVDELINTICNTKWYHRRGVF